MAGLLAGATVWGLVWYPYRVLEDAGLSGSRAVIATYMIALVFGILVFAPRIRRFRIDGWLIAVGLTAGACNLGYVLAMLHGEVMRVLLLFYLSPLWTVFLARLLLGERIDRGGLAVVAMSLAGAAIMLWQPAAGLPWPRNLAEWTGMASGFLFALSNVLIRKTHGLSIEIKSLAVFFGVVVCALVTATFETPIDMAGMGADMWWLTLVVGLVLLVVNVVVQFGLTHTPANRAIVILLFELVVAAISAWLLADEAMGLKEWLGGGLIVAASLLTLRSGADPEPVQQ